MSSYTSHLCMNQKIRKIFNFSEQFLLGGIMPDLLKDSKTLTRKQSHFLEIGQNRNIYHLEWFCQENPLLFTKPYDEMKLGYLSHLIQDKVLSEYIYTRTENVTIEEKQYKKYLFLDHTLKPYSVYKQELYSDYKNMELYLLEKNGYDANTLREYVLSVNPCQKHQEIIKQYVYTQEKENNHYYLLEQSFLEQYQQECINIFQKMINQKRK